MHDEELGLIDVGALEPTQCWCGQPTDETDRGALGVSFCPTCRARLVRSCASILAIARGRAVARRRPRSAG